MALPDPQENCAFPGLSQADIFVPWTVVHQQNAALLLAGHDFPDSEALFATRGAHLPEAETLYVGRWKVGVHLHWIEWELGGASRAPG